MKRVENQIRNRMFKLVVFHTNKQVDKEIAGQLSLYIEIHTFNYIWIETHDMVGNRIINNIYL